MRNIFSMITSECIQLYILKPNQSHALFVSNKKRPKTLHFGAPVCDLWVHVLCFFSLLRWIKFYKVKTVY